MGAHGSQTLTSTLSETGFLAFAIMLVLVVSVVRGFERHEISEYGTTRYETSGHDDMSSLLLPGAERKSGACSKSCGFDQAGTALSKPVTYESSRWLNNGDDVTMLLQSCRENISPLNVCQRYSVRCASIFVQGNECWLLSAYVELRKMFW